MGHPKEEQKSILGTNKRLIAQLLHKRIIKKTKIYHRTNTMHTYDCEEKKQAETEEGKPGNSLQGLQKHYDDLRKKIRSALVRLIFCI